MAAAEKRLGAELARRAASSLADADDASFAARRPIPGLPVAIFWRGPMSLRGSLPGRNRAHPAHPARSRARCARSSAPTARGGRSSASTRGSPGGSSAAAAGARPARRDPATRDPALLGAAARGRWRRCSRLAGCSSRAPMVARSSISIAPRASGAAQARRDDRHARRPFADPAQARAWRAGGSNADPRSPRTRQCPSCTRVPARGRDGDCRAEARARHARR